MALQTTDFGVSLKIRWASGQAEFAQHCLSISFTRHLISIIERKKERIHGNHKDIWWFIWQTIFKIMFKGKAIERHCTNCHYTSSDGPGTEKLRTRSCIKNEEEVNHKSQTNLKHVITIGNFLSFGTPAFGHHPPKQSLYKEKERESHGFGGSMSQDWSTDKGRDWADGVSRVPRLYSTFLVGGAVSPWHLAAFLHLLCTRLRNSGGSAELTQIQLWCKYS